MRAAQTRMAVGDGKTLTGLFRDRVRAFHREPCNPGRRTAWISLGTRPVSAGLSQHRNKRSVCDDQRLCRFKRSPCEVDASPGGSDVTSTALAIMSTDIA